MLKTPRLYSSLHKSKQVLELQKPGCIGLYVCGMTVYDLCHIGHARVMLVFDALVGFWQFLGYKLQYVRNITDIDDKILQRAIELREPPLELSARMIAEMQQDFSQLGIKTPHAEPQVSQHLEAIYALITRLIDKQHAYVTPLGNVYFSVASFPDYGKLSGRKLEEGEERSRVENEQDKRAPQDFALWKAAQADELHWNSAWGKGRPGWHIECSAMAMEYLGESFDIHGGGSDLLFPHHENEIAQSCAATEKGFANYWLHVGSLRVDNEKMSKSLGNFILIRDALKNHHPEVIRLFMLQNHYRSEMNYAEEQLSASKKNLILLYDVFAGVEIIDSSQADEAILENLLDDFNTPKFFAALFSLLKSNASQEQIANKKATAASILKSMGLLQAQKEEIESYGKTESSLSEEVIEDLIAKRNQARSEKNWQQADQIRDQLLQQGIVLKDSSTGTSWNYQ